MFNNYPQPMPNLNYVFGFVHGRSGADAFFVPTSCAAILFDLDAQVFYLKQTDQYSVAYPIREFTYTERQHGAQNAPFAPAQVESVNRDINAEINALTKRVAALEGVKDNV